MSEPEEVKLYFDYKSPFAYLAKDPALELEREFDVALRWIPYFLKLKGPGERSQASEWKAKYSYLDARRWANARPDPLTVRGRACALGVRDHRQQLHRARRGDYQPRRPGRGAAGHLHANAETVALARHSGFA